MTLYYARLTWHQTPFILAASETALCFIGAGKTCEEDLRAFHRRYFVDQVLVEDEVQMATYKRAVEHYLKGNPFPICAYQMYGSPFQQKVWQSLVELPFGSIRTYLEIAQSIGRPEAVRAVANAIASNPLLLLIPCHRIIRKDGSLSGYRGGIALKRKLLQLERVHVKED